DAYQLFMDVNTLYQLFKILDGNSLRAAKIADALEQFTLQVDFEQEREERILDYRKAREKIRPVLEAHNGSTMPTFYAIGNAHIDLAWLWTMEETHRKVARTFAAQLRMIREYPDYKYLQSQPAAYEMCRQYYPELFEEIREAIRSGRWIAEGGMWVEPDTNMAGGEALVRQLLTGKRYYKEVLGVDSRILWLPDTFGYTAALPQILKGCGIEYLVTQKIFWSYNEGEQFPYHYFNWEGMDGTRIVSFLPTSYTYRTGPEEINHVWNNRTQKRDIDAFLLPFGYGDGGGGPTRDHIEYAKRQQDLEGGVKVKQAAPIEFFKDMEKMGGAKNTYVGELYFSAHRGTYTTQAGMKQNNRRCELALREMEFWSSLAIGQGMVYDYEKADFLWKQLLLHQFHDILPGSSIAKVYVDAGKALDRVINESKEVESRAQEMLSVQQDEAVTVWNSLSFSRRALVKLPETFAKGAQTVAGEHVPVQVVDGEVKALVKLPACGAVSVIPQEVSGTETAGVSVCEIEGGYTLENRLVCVQVDRKGQVTSFVRKESGREFAAGPMNCFRLFKDIPRMYDAWDIDSNYLDQEIEGLTEAVLIPKTSGLEGVLELHGKIGNSQLVQKICLTAESDRLEFVTDINWLELHRLLKVSFPVAVHVQNGINEMQFGYVERPTHRSRLYDKDRFEVCNHRYSALCDGSHGAAVLNDCKYGISMNDNALELTLLRAAASPEMRTDNGMNTFSYAFTAWEGSFADSEVVQHGYELNVKPSVTIGRTDIGSMFSVDQKNVILETLKPAEDQSGDFIMRLYEAQKASGEVKITCNMDVKSVWLCDMLENVQKEVPVEQNTFLLSFGAFEIKTVRIKH
ncbi:MAG: alpha-mannosidase, partial [Acetatifactor sp.]|nr:alpha-mannosidase [Acetatifactor sp.]